MDCRASSALSISTGRSSQPAAARRSSRCVASRSGGERQSESEQSEAIVASISAIVSALSAAASSTPDANSCADALLGAMTADKEAAEDAEERASSTVTEHSPNRQAHVERLSSAGPGPAAAAAAALSEREREACSRPLSWAWMACTCEESAATLRCACSAARRASSQSARTRRPEEEMRWMSCCSLSSLSVAGRVASTFSPTLTMHFTTSSSAPASLSASASPTTGSSPGTHTLPYPDPSPAGPMYCPAFTAPCTRIGTCPRYAHQCPRASCSGVGCGSPFHLALRSETTRSISASHSASAGTRFPHESATMAPLGKGAWPALRWKK
mmetsp:Transcript_36060/g.84735  ORF Transcript_36060/g.84735 Transcript_36060/m.84735 type:complete len:328 (+) Transcript_36060:1602-2585(+)